MRTLALTLLALVAAAGGALGAERALRTSAPPPPALSLDAGDPLFTLEGLRHGDRAERCVAVTNEGPGAAAAVVSGRREDGDLAPLLRAAVTRGCGEGGTLLYSGPLSDLSAPDPAPWPPGEVRRYGIAVEVTGADAEVQGRRAVHELAFAATAAEDSGPAAAEAPGSAEAPAPAASREGRGPGAAEASASAACRTVSLGRHSRRVLVKRHRVGARVHAKLIVRVYGLPGRERLVLVTGLRIGRRVLPGRRFGRVAYRVDRGAALTSRRRPFRIRVAPGALRPGRNVVRVTVVPRGGRPVRARYILTLRRTRTGCIVG
jgi:hypothetical protein